MVELIEVELGVGVVDAMAHFNMLADRSFLNFTTIIVDVGPDGRTTSKTRHPTRGAGGEQPLQQSLLGAPGMTSPRILSVQPRASMLPRDTASVSDMGLFTTRRVQENVDLGRKLSFM